MDKTLERLDTDYIDLLLIHQPAGNYIAGYQLMEKAYKEGKVRAIGLSNFTPDQIREILDICEVKPAVLQTEVHPYSQEKELKKFLAKEGMVIQAWYPLGHGDKALHGGALVHGARQEVRQEQRPDHPALAHPGAATSSSPAPRTRTTSRPTWTCSTSPSPTGRWREIAAMDQQKRYYHSTPEMLKRYAEMVPDVDGQK